MALDTALPVSGPAVVAHAANDLRIDELALTAPAADEAVVEVAFGGICGSDLHYWLHGAAGESILRAPLVLGHEISGTVVRAAADGTLPSVRIRGRVRFDPQQVAASVLGAGEASTS